MSQGGYLKRHQQAQFNINDTKSSISSASNQKSLKVFNKRLQLFKSQVTGVSEQKRELDKMDLLEKMKVNEEKHKQLMIENQKRRKEQVKKLKQQEDEKLAKHQQLLGQRKKDKEDAYIKYLRQNTKNVVESLKKGISEQQKIPEQSKTQYPPSAPKPPLPQNKQSITTYQPKNYNTFDALDIEVRRKPIEIPSKKVDQVRQDFEQNWANENEFNVMRQSELLDSLNLEISTVKRKNNQPQKKNDDIIEEIIGYQEANSDNEEDEFWNFTLKNGKRESKKLQKINNLPEREITKHIEKQQQQQQQRDLSVKNQNTNQINQQISQNNQKITETKIITNIAATQNRQSSKPRQKQQNSQQRKKSPNTVISRENEIDVKEFLREDILHLNNEEAKLQQDLYQFDQMNNPKIEAINQQHKLRTNLQSSHQVRNSDAKTQQNVKVVVQQKEDEIEASLLRLDDLLKQQKQINMEKDKQINLIQNQFQFNSQNQDTKNEYQRPSIQQQKDDISIKKSESQTQKVEQKAPQSNFTKQDFRTNFIQYQKIDQPNSQMYNYDIGILKDNQIISENTLYGLPKFPTVQLHQDNQEFQQSLSINSEQMQQIQEQLLQNNQKYKQQQEIKTPSQNEQKLIEQLTKLIQKNPEIIQQLGILPKIELNNQEDTISCGQSTVSDGKAFKISKRKGTLSIKSQNETNSDISTFSTQSQGYQKTKTYTQVAAIKKQKNEQPLVEEEEENLEDDGDGKIKMTAKAQILFD